MTRFMKLEAARLSSSHYAFPKIKTLTIACLTFARRTYTRCADILSTVWSFADQRSKLCRLTRRRITDTPLSENMHNNLYLSLRLLVVDRPLLGTRKMVAAAAEVFAASSISISVVSTRRLRHEELSQIAIGKCRTGQLTMDQIQLFELREGAAA